MVRGKDGIYISWEVFQDYATKGSLILKRMVQYAINELIEENLTLKTTLPAQGIATVTKQINRYIVHLLYGVPVKRGLNTEVIEDIQPLYNIQIQLKVEEKVSRIYLAPQGTDLEYQVKDGVVNIVVPEVNLHQMLVLEH